MGDVGVVSKSGVVISRIEEALEERGVDQPCPRCGNKDFAVLDGVVLLQPKAVVYGVAYMNSGRPIPLVVVFCTNCGYKFEHLVELLDVDLDDSEEEEE